jgi:hypothetical protein
LGDASLTSARIVQTAQVLISRTGCGIPCPW